MLPKNDFGELSQDEKSMAMFAHVLGIVLCFIGPLIVWTLRRYKSRFVEENSKVALNFQVTMLILYILGAVLNNLADIDFTNYIFFLINVIFSIINGLKAENGELPKYPFSIMFVR